MSSISTQHHQENSSIDEEDEACIYAMQLSTSYIVHVVLNAAIELQLFDIIAQAGPGAQLSAATIASKLPTNNPDAPSKLDYMLHLLAANSLLTCSFHTLEDGSVQKIYGLSAAGKFYVRSNDGGTLASLPLLSGHRAMREVWYNMKDTILDGGNQLKKVHGIPVFQYMKNDATLNQVFNKAMADLSAMKMKKILNKYKGFEGLTSLVDVGGGFGITIKKIISKYPSINGINFDLPQVILNAPTHPGITHVGGDMFSSIPKADAIMIKETCHNWGDEHCVKIFKNCYASLPENGKVILIEFLMPIAPDSSNRSKYVSQLHHTMQLNHEGGKERTDKEFETLSKAAGFSKFQVICCAITLGVMEFYK
nr:caffeic acid O-methyltransferase 2 [Paeonia lactiflora]